MISHSCVYYPYFILPKLYKFFYIPLSHHKSNTVQSFRFFSSFNFVLFPTHPLYFSILPSASLYLHYFFSILLSFTTFPNCLISSLFVFLVLIPNDYYILVLSHAFKTRHSPSVGDLASFLIFADISFSESLVFTECLYVPLCFLYNNLIIILVQFNFVSLLTHNSALSPICAPVQHQAKANLLQKNV